MFQDPQLSLNIGLWPQWLANLWLIALLKTFGVNYMQPAFLYYDRKAALYVAANPMYHERTKHVEVDCHFIREKIQDGVIKNFHIPTRHQIADFFTKALGKRQFFHLLSKMNLINIYSSSWGGVLNYVEMKNGRRTA